MAGSKALLLLLCAAAVLLTPASAAEDGLTKFKLYWHDVLAGTSPTAIRIAQAASSNSSSKDEIGRAQGTYTFADQATFGLLMNMNFVFTAGDYKGSGLTIYGRNEVLSAVREMSIIGGTGKFRMARGYVEARTMDSGAKSGETVVEYTVYVKAAAAS
ncbi:unnamed protein product [Triticum turgidum subsp. durum]|uniref:Dirigent protein n=1 Tax=Triticum turgidum subsp. durum TaxID=4567 RepID=A0A9R0W8Z8_TRITD|nr:unnamed protein product [Triticum turgidum subsp. durum]